MIASSRNYAIGWVHFLIGGGWKVTTIILAAYVFLFGAGVALFYYVEFMAREPGGGPAMVPDLARVVLILLMGIQGLVLLLVGGYRVAGAIRMDISSRMLESHRLMPISSANAVWGYLFGPTTGVLAFALLNLALSCAFGSLHGVSPGRLMINQAVILAFAVFTWSLIALGTFIYRHMFFIALALMFLGMCTTLIIYAPTLFPGLGLILTPFLGETIFSFGGAGVGKTFDEGYAFGAAGQAALFLIFFLGTCRLYRGVYRVVFTEFQAVALLAVWAVLSTLGLWYSNRIGIQHLFFGMNQEFDETLGMAQIVASVASCVVLAFVPFWSFLQEDRRRATHPLLRLGSIVAVALLAALPAAGAMWMSSYSIVHLELTLLIVVSQVAILYALLRLAHRMRFWLAAIVAGGALLVLWVGPLALEVGRIAVLNWQGGNEHDLSVLGTLSPLGYLAAVWDGNGNLPLLPGLVVQLLAAVVLCTVAYLVVRLKMPESSSPAAPPIVAPPRSVPS